MWRWLRGKKRYLGIFTYAAARALEGAGKISAGTSDVIELIGGTVFGIGYVDAEKRKLEEIKKQAK